MNRGVKASLLISCATIGGCSATTSEVKVRAIANPSAALERGGDAVTVARGQLMLGNAGLALEGFRKAQRDNPANPAALAGIGDCYVAMSRFDLAQSNYEAALALAPHDRTLLLGLAAIFEREGLPLRAMAARAEAGAAAQPAPVSAPVIANVAAPPAPPLTKVVAKAPAQPAPLVTNLLAKAPAQPAPPTTKAAVALAQPAPAVVAVVPAPVVTVVAQAEPPVKIPAPSVGSITVELPPARTQNRLATQAAVIAASELDFDEPASSSVTVPLPPISPTQAPDREAIAEQAPVMAEAPAPRLERLSSGEVALVTTGKPIWNKPQNLLAAASSVRWVALARPGTRPNIQILNAARSQGLAASARTVLLDRGWRKLAIGDAPAVETKSVVLYSKGREKLGRSLAAQFGVAARMVERDVLVLVLGRDSVDRLAGPRKS